MSEALTQAYRQSQPDDYPLGHPSRRQEGIPLPVEKFATSLSQSPLTGLQIDRISSAFNDSSALEKMPVDVFMDIFSVS